MAIPQNDYPILKGINFEVKTLYPDSSAKVTNIVPPGTKVVSVGANVNGVNDFIVLPALAETVNGHQILVICNAAGMEIRTPASSNEKINNTDSDGTAEYTVPAGGQLHFFTKISTTIGWEAHGFTAIGAAVTAIVPDA